MLASAIALAFALAAAYMASFFIARRLKRIESGAGALAQGDFETPIEPGIRDEIGQLAMAFNDMGQRLRAAFALIAREKENAEVLLNDLAEGVIGASQEGRVAVANPAAGWLARHSASNAAPHLDAVLPETLAVALADVRGDGEDRIVAFRHGDDMLEGSVYLIDRESEVRHLIVLRNVTEQARLDQARRDFIATASHELKTPLFSLSGFMELIDEGDLDAEQQREFLALMRQQVDRLTDLSLILLDLSQVDAGTVSLEFGDVDVAEVARTVAAEFRAAASQHAASTSSSTVRVAASGLLRRSGAWPGAAGPARQRGQVLPRRRNGPRWRSPCGAGWCRSASPTRDPGIPRKEIGRIFERFYRGAADGGAKQGTGLGLSIARDMAELMGGTPDRRAREPGHGAQSSPSRSRSEPLALIACRTQLTDGATGLTPCGDSTERKAPRPADIVDRRAATAASAHGLAKSHRRSGQMRFGTFVLGLVGGVVGAGILVLALFLLGVTDVTKTETVKVTTPTVYSPGGGTSTTEGKTPAELYNEHANGVVEIFATFPSAGHRHVRPAAGRRSGPRARASSSTSRATSSPTRTWSPNRERRPAK